MGEVIAFVFGLIYGSFLNVVILRFDDWISIIRDRSHCPNCKEQLRWYDLVPVVSFICLRARCRYCHKPISWQYPAVELMTAVLLAAGYWVIFVTSIFSLTMAVLAFALYVLIIGCLVVIFTHDLKEMMIPDYLSYFLLIICLLFGWIMAGSLKDVLIGGLIGFLPVALLVYPSRGRWMGEGDVKIAASLGLMTAYPLSLVFLAVAFISGGAFGVLALISKKAKLKTAVPFAPFLIIGGLVAFFWGYQLINWYFGFLNVY
ncbi:MAG TPA: prepilin peptidase [Candidatus Saccharimonadales bacterium]|nr:prepilin peptidase [Candidatus Saccharimonadales bacterium]